MNALERITRARAGLILSAPFYASLALTLGLEDRGDVETMATDGTIIFYGAQFVADCTDAELRGVIAHEVMHVANLHHTRRNGRDAEQWNVACDLAINPQLLAEGFTLPQGCLLDASLAGKSAEQIYAGLPAKQPGQGAGKGAPGGVLDAAPASDPAANASAELDAKARVLQAVQAAKGAGQSSEGGTRAADAIKAPAIDWRDVLRRYVDAASRVEYAWSRPNRRHVASGVYLPGKIPDGMARLAVIIDTSGSVDAAMLAAFLSELQGAVDDAEPEAVDVIQCDSKVKARQEFERGELIDVQINGGGGTNMQPALDLCGDASAVVCFTDCEFGNREPVDNCGVPVLWVRWGTRGRVPSWGESVAFPPLG